MTSGQGVAVPALGRCDHALVTQSAGMRAVVGSYSGFRVSFRFWLVGVRGVAAGDPEGDPRLHWSWTFWLTIVTSLAVGFGCVVLIFMAGRRLTWMSRSGHVTDLWHSRGCTGGVVLIVVVLSSSWK